MLFMQRRAWVPVGYPGTEPRIAASAWRKQGSDDIMNKENLRAYKIVSHQFLTLLRIEFPARENNIPLSSIIAGLESRNISIRFLSSDLSSTGAMVFNIGVDLLSEELKHELLEELGADRHGWDAALISQVSMAMLYGPHFGEMPGIAAAALASLAATNIFPVAASASASTLSYLFPSPQYKTALDVLTGVFQPPESSLGWND
jgi:aspartokinase